MIDVEPAIRGELERLAPAVDELLPDWRDVTRRAGGMTPRFKSNPGTERSRWRITLVTIAVALAIATPAVALSASVRSFLGLGEPVGPDYAHAKLVVSAPLPGGRVARLWVGPSTKGGECVFVTYDPASSEPQATRMTGGGACALGAQVIPDRLTWSFTSGARATPPVLNGRTDPSNRAARVELRWRGGSRVLEFRRGYFIGAAPELRDPPFPRLPYDVVVLDSHGKVREKSRIPTSFLYRDWKDVEPRLRAYRVVHGCDRVVVWDCESR